MQELVYGYTGLLCLLYPGNATVWLFLKKASLERSRLQNYCLDVVFVMITLLVELVFGVLTYNYILDIPSK